MRNIQFRLMGHRPGEGVISWEEEAGGQPYLFHFQCTVPGLNPTGLIVRRKEGARMFGRDTSYRDPNKERNSQLIAEAQRLVRERGLIEKAQAELAAAEAEKERREKARSKLSLERAVGPQAIEHLRALIECFGQDAIRAQEVCCPALDGARQLIRELESPTLIECRDAVNDGDGEPRWHWASYAANERAARENFAAQCGRHLAVPEEIEARRKEPTNA